jgi:poly(hydroxyalkanoate) granule-associated protein
MATVNESMSIQKIQDGLMASTRKVWLASLGALSAVEDESAQLFDQLVERGKSVESKGRKQVTKAKKELENTTDELTVKLDGRVSEVLRRMGVPSQSQVQELTLRVEQLTDKVDQLSAPVKTTSAPQTTTKSAAKKAPAPQTAKKTTAKKT